MRSPSDSPTSPTSPSARTERRRAAPQGSGILTSMSLASAWLVVSEERPRTDAGAIVHALIPSEDAALTAPWTAVTTT